MSRPMSKGVSWSLRKDHRDNVMVDPDDEDLILVQFAALRSDIQLDRATARLLAKRINQCLDATVKR